MLIACLVCARGASAGKPARAASPESPYAKWQHGPPHDAGFFPIAVWLQDPSNAGQYRAAGINTYVGLWKGPTENQLAALTAAGMRLICAQNATARKHLDDPVIIGWMHGDEPDNAQSLGDSKGYGPPIPASAIIADYVKIQAADPRARSCSTWAKAWPGMATTAAACAPTTPRITRNTSAAVTLSPSTFTPWRIRTPKS